MNKWAKWLIAVIVLAIIIWLYPKLLPYADVDALRELLAPFGALASALFVIIYIIAGLLFLPLSAFSIAAGILFGTLWGLVIVLFAATATGALAFIISRQFSTLLPQAKAGIIKKMQKAIEKRLHRNTFQTIFILRLLYMPYIFLSFAAGLVKTCKFWPFIGATFVTNIIGSFIFVYLGDQLSKGLTALIIPVILIILSLMIPYVVKKFIKKR